MILKLIIDVINSPYIRSRFYLTCNGFTMVVLFDHVVICIVLFTPDSFYVHMRSLLLLQNVLKKRQTWILIDIKIFFGNFISGCKNIDKMFKGCFYIKHGHMLLSLKTYLSRCSYS